ncbi:sterol desaturase family protein [Neptuniibacter sp. SY11_33]|uniref:sterol desaturase family protein n=1 Tax=Neptuniibacter sp. SY11_33 TaxID=3398215 RepID=UPI0039F52C45
MLEIFSEFYNSVLVDFTDSKKRVYWGYLLAALVIAVVWLAQTKRVSVGKAISVVFSAKVWWSQSAKADYLIFVINKFAFVFIAPLLLTHITVSQWLFFKCYEWWGYQSVGNDWPLWTITALFTFSYFILNDFSRFFVHKLLHEVPFLWEFHKVHHSARVLTPITVFRTHPVEGILFSFRSIFVQGFLIAIFTFLFGDRVDLFMFYGVVVTTFLFNVLGANLRHSQIAIGYWNVVERWLISPAQHQIHHSTLPKHFDKNYGVILAVWDRWTGTLVHSERDQELEFGISRKEQANEQNVLYLYFQPFKSLFSRLRRISKPKVASDN